MNTSDRPQKPQVKETLTFKKLDEEINERVDKIEEEFQKGFNFIKNHKKSVTFFGSARTKETERDYIAARSLANRISKELGYAVVTGGAHGAMEAANRGAFEAGGKSLGLNINLPEEHSSNPYLTNEMNFNYFFTRKVTMSFSAEAYVFIPGGFGTFDELFEILTLIQTKKVEKVPVILYGKDFWDDVDKLIKDKLLGGEKIDEEDIDLYTITDDEDEVLELIRKAPIRDGIDN